MKVGIVGSRKYTDRKAVQNLVKSLKPDDVVVSGGCRGVDTWAEQEARKRRLGRIIFEPDLSAVRNRGEAARKYFERNLLIARECDVLHAFVASDRKGGTENTIAHARKLKKPVITHE